jgi:hypothetical protein
MMTSAILRRVAARQLLLAGLSGIVLLVYAQETWERQRFGGSRSGRLTAGR